MLERLNEWNHALGQMLDAPLQAGSLTAVLVVFAAGLVTSLTPCVYPVIPVTVTYIGGAAAGNRRRAFSLSLIYVVGMATLYSTLGVAAAMLGKIFGQFTRTPWVYGAVGLLIVLFGIAMLDFLNVPVPGALRGLQVAGAQRGGYAGALLLGLASGFVTAPCTAPVLGGLLAYVARTRDVVWGGALLMVFALGLGTLLLVLGVFSGLLTSIPRPGPWMTWVKRVFGILLVGIGSWFLFQAVTMVVGGGA